MWVRGLKQNVAGEDGLFQTSHPMWVRGLKPTVRMLRWGGAVAPYVGAWIETSERAMIVPSGRSHPMWVRGLKHRRGHHRLCVERVAPYVGAWIETRTMWEQNLNGHVAPYVGAWIET